MRRLTAWAAAALLLAACQKEPSFEDPSGSGAAGTRLVRIGTRTGADSVTTHFSYNAAGQLTLIRYEGTVMGQSADAAIKITRNSSGIITQTVTTADVFGGFGLDSVVTRFAYDAAKKTFRHAVGTYEIFGFPFIDSAVFNHDAAGRLTSTISYNDDGGGYELFGKMEYTFAGANLASQKEYSHDGSTYELEAETVFDAYDAKINPLSFPNDAPALTLSSFYSANNPVKRTLLDHTASPPDSESATFTYTYNNKNRPVTVSSTEGGASSVSTYYYQ